MLTEEQYQEYVDRLASRELKLNLSRTPTTMGPGYIADKIAEILDSKSIVNEMSEKVELALCDAEVKLNDLEEEVQLRTHLEYQNLDPDDSGFRNAKSREAYVWGQVEKGYVDDYNRANPDQIQFGQFQLSMDLAGVKSDIIKLKALLKIIDHRRDELAKLDSGVRLQQKTMETEAAIYGKGGIPRPGPTGNGAQDYRGPAPPVDREVDELDDPAAVDDDFDTDPPPIE